MAATADVTFTFQELELVLATVKLTPPQQQSNILFQDLVRKLTHVRDLCKLDQKVQLVKARKIQKAPAPIQKGKK